MPSSKCCFLTCIQISQEAGQVMVWYSHLFQNFPVYCDPHSRRFWHSQESRNIFLGFSCFFDDPADVGNLISGSSAFSKTSSNIWKLSVHKLLKPGLENFEHYFISIWDECNCAVVWAFFGIAFLWDWNENWPLKWYIFPFLLSFSLPFSSQLFVRPPQTAILLFCISFPWGWSWSLSPAQCH